MSPPSALPIVAGSRNPTTYSLKNDVSPEKTLMRTSVLPAMQCTRPVAGMRNTGAQMSNNWEVVSRAAAASQTTKATSHPPTTPLTNKAKNPFSILWAASSSKRFMADEGSISVWVTANAKAKAPRMLDEQDPPQPQHVRPFARILIHYHYHRGYGVGGKQLLPRHHHEDEAHGIDGVSQEANPAA